MPALRPQLHQSAHLQTLCQNIIVLPHKDSKKRMEPPPAATHGKGRWGRGGSASIHDLSPASISWQNVPQWTIRLVDFLIEHSADCTILFAMEGKKSANYHGANLSCPLGKDKGEIHSIIVRVVFQDDPVYANWYATNPVEFHDSVANQIGFLQSKFRDICSEFESMGVGIVPIDSEMSENLHCKIQKDFPWYNDLYGIWGSNPSFSAKTSSSKPGADHAGDLFMPTHPARSSQPASSHTHPQPPMSSLNPASGSGSSPQFGSMALPLGAHTPQFGNMGNNTSLKRDYTGNSSMQAAHTALLPISAGGATGPPQFNHAHNTQGASSAGSSPLWNFPQAPSSSHPDSTANSPLQLNYSHLPPGSQSFSCNNYSLAPPDLTNYHDDPCFDDGPLADDMKDLHMDDADEIPHDKENLPSSPSPSPPPSFLSPSCTSIHDGRSSSKSHANQLIMHENSQASSTTSSSRAPLACGWSSSHQGSPTSQTSFSEKLSGRDSVMKCLQTEVQEQVDMLNDDLDSMHSEKLTLYQLKNKRLMVKLNANHQMNEHNFLREEHENKAQEIHLWEADAKALKLEREVMLLCIEYAKLTQK
ncbi:uncharacterized protein BJ212DRAFT_1479206 [Suillus subaureus]|uniref:Uncharacterized protein n=1 Tax=Suillus subaureus TaxID=48587 RepID=A0A9P7JF44_9AGAM|nr:uncharacterized protein BJ212DRAFT_1479206 [Suillus subaureus]KAG1819091.1 hypothetical protein BJ212DRAFT_1479206 [Suillus subaureus]